VANIHFDRLRIVVNRSIKEIDASDPETHSTEWFLLKYLRRIAKRTQPPSEPGQVEGSMRSLVRFYIDNIDEKSNTGSICMDIYEEYRKVLREHQSKNG
jgi:hypothetical protein